MRPTDRAESVESEVCSALKAWNQALRTAESALLEGVRRLLAVESALEEAVRKTSRGSKTAGGLKSPLDGGRVEEVKGHSLLVLVDLAEESPFAFVSVYVDPPGSGDEDPLDLRAAALGDAGEKKRLRRWLSRARPSTVLALTRALAALEEELLEEAARIGEEEGP